MNNIISFNIYTLIFLASIASQPINAGDTLTQKYRDCRINLNKAQNAYKNTLQELWNEQDSCTRVSRSNPILKSNYAFSGYPVNNTGGGKADNISKNIFPKQPKRSSRESKWLKAHNNELLHVVKKVLNPNEQKNYPLWEKKRCPTGSLYCTATARQKIIACSQDIGC